MNAPDYDIIVQPVVLEFSEGWDNPLTRYMSDEDYTTEQLIEDDYQANKQKYAKQLIRSILT